MKACWGLRGGGTGRRRAPAACGAALAIATVLAAALALPAAVAAKPRDPVQILSPRTNALVTSGAVRVRVRVRRPLQSLRVAVRGSKTREVTSRMRRGRGGVRTVTLRLGRELAVGENHLYVTARLPNGGRRVVASHFVVARPHRGMLSLRGVAHGGYAPVIARVHVAAGATLRARLNGRGVRREFERSAKGRLTARLAADNGLRFGRNRLTLTAFTRSGRYERLRRTFTIRRDRPLVGAGRDHRGVAGAAVRLDGSSTRAAHRGAKLRLRWTIVSKPKGSHARLRGARRAHPRLRTDRPGHYVVALTARARRPHHHRGHARRGHRGPPAFTGAAGVSPAATDRVTVDAQADALPEGVPVKTIVSHSKPGIQVGSTFYPAWEPHTQGWVQLLVLDRKTLEPVPIAGNTVNTLTGDWPGTGSLATDIAKLSSEDLVIVSGVGRSASLNDDALNALQGALSGIGASFPDGVASLQDGNWSVIGVPGAPQGSAYQCVDIYCTIAPGAVPGEMAGSLMLDDNDNFAFSWPSKFDTFDTRAPGSTSTKNVMQIGFGDNAPETYSSAQIDGPGFHLLWLDSGSLAVRGNYTYSASTTPGCSDCLPSMAAKLHQITTDSTPGLIMLSSFGGPSVPSPSRLNWWGYVAWMLEGMGANPRVFLNLPGFGFGDYTFVGLEGLQQANGPNAGAELSQPETGKTARLAGLFRRNRQGLWHAGVNGNPGPVNPPSTFQPGISKILAQPDQPFPFPKTAAQWAAERWIARKASKGGLQLPVDPKFGIRVSYWRNLDIDWDSKAGTLRNMAPCHAKCPAGFQVAVFYAVRNELVDEFSMINQLREFLIGGGAATLSGVYNKAFQEGSYDFTGVANDIRQLYEPPPVKPHGPSVLGILDGVLSIASGASGAVPEAGDAISAPFTIADGVVVILQAVDNNSDGSSAADPATFDGDIYSWGNQLVGAGNGIIDGLTKVFALLVSDRGRLAAADAKIDSYQSGSTSGWGFDTQSEAALRKSLTRSMGQYLWSTMLPASVQVAVCSNRPREISSGLIKFNQPIFGAGGFGFQNVWAFGYAPPAGKALKQSIVDTLFSPNVDPDAGNVNLDPTYFFSLANVTGRTDSDPGTPTSPGFLQTTKHDNAVVSLYYNCDYP